jgi:ribosomal protein L40E
MITYIECSECKARYNGKAANHLIFEEGINLGGREIDPKKSASVNDKRVCMECGHDMKDAKTMYGPCMSLTWGHWPEHKFRDGERYE